MTFFVPRVTVERRAIDPAAFITGADTGPGYTPRAVSMDRALKLAPVYAASRTIADDVAALPVEAFTTAKGGQRSPVDLPPLLQNPAAEGSLYDWVFQPIISLALRGNAYGLITALDRNGWPLTIEWLNPEDVIVRRNQGRIEYLYDSRPVDASSLVHIRGYLLPGSPVGLSPIAYYATTIETGLMAGDFGHDWFKNGSTPAAVLESDKVIDDDVATSIKERFKAAARKRQVVSMGSGLKYRQISVAANESQFIETEKLTATKIAGLYGIRPERIGGDAAGSMTYANVEQNSIVDADALRPWVARFEAALARITPPGQVIKLDLDANIRADIATRYAAHAVGITAGFLEPSEARVAEDLPPVAGIDDRPRAPHVPPAAPAPAPVAPREMQPIEVNVAAPVITVEAPGVRSRRIERDEHGEITRIIEER